MDVVGVLQLEKRAKSKGGDKYTGELSNEESKEAFNAYIPQGISRKDSNYPIKRFTIVIVDKKEISPTTKVEKSVGTGIWIRCILKKVAKSGGGDRYDGVSNKESIAIYIPQCFTRSLTKKPMACKWIVFYSMDNHALQIVSDTSSSSSKMIAAIRPLPTVLEKRLESFKSDGTNPDESTKRPRIGTQNPEVPVHDLVSDTEDETFKDQKNSSDDEIIFAEYLCKNDDDSIIEAISDPNGNFDIQKYLDRKIARVEELTNEHRSN